MVVTLGNDAIHAAGEHQTVIDTVKQYAAETHHGAEHVDRWNRVLAGFGDASKHTDPMTAQEAQVNTYRFNPDRWQPVADALASVQNVVTDKEAALITAATEWSQEAEHGATHVERWQRVLAALGVAGYEDKTPMTTQEAQKFADKGWVRWTHVIDVLNALESDTTSMDANADTDMDTNRIGNGGGTGDGVSAQEVQPLQIQTPSEIIIRPGFINNLKSYAGETHHGSDHVKRWERVLYTFGVDGYNTADSKMTAEEAQKLADQGWKRWNAVVKALTDLEQHGMLRDVSATLVTHDSITIEWWEPFIQRNYTIIVGTLNETNSNQSIVISNQTILTGASLGVSSHTVGGLDAETDYFILVKINALQRTVIPSVSTLPAPTSLQNEMPVDTPQPLQEADVTPPSITVAGDGTVTLESTGATTTVTLQLPTVSDDADANPTISTNITGTWQAVSSATVSHSFELGTHTVHWRATDASSNTVYATQSVIIEDTTAPTIVVGVAITVTSEGATTPVTLQVPLVSDDTDANPTISTNITGTWQTVSSTQVEHSLALGTHTVYWRATDASSNTADATQSVTIIDVVFEQSDIGLNSEFGMPQQSTPQYTPVDMFTMSLSSDDHTSSPLGTIQEGGHIWFRLYNNTDNTEPTTEHLIQLEARYKVKQYEHSARTTGWSNWGPVGNYVESGMTSTNNLGKALKDLYSGDTTNCCVNGSYWRHDTVLDRWYTTHTLVSHDDNYIGEAERHYEFRIKDEHTQKFTVIIKEDDSSGGASYPSQIQMKLTRSDGNSGMQKLDFKLGKSHFDGYRIKLTTNGTADRMHFDGRTITIGADRTPYDTETFEAYACFGAGEGWVFAKVIGGDGLPTPPIVSPDRLQICY